MKRKVLWIVLAAVVLAAAGGFAYWKRGPKPVEVQIATVERANLQAKVSANGNIQAQKKVERLGRGRRGQGRAWSAPLEVSGYSRMQCPIAGDCP